MAQVISYFENLSTKNIIVILICLGFVVYFNSLFNNFIIGDDYALVVNNPLVHSISNINTLLFSGIFPDDGSGQANNYYRPVETISYALIYSIFGAASWAFHVLQIIFHVSNSILVFLILKSFFKKLTALFISLIFLVHPINTEAVSYIAVLQDVQFMFFGLLALYITTKFRKGYIFLISSISLFLSLLAKEAGSFFVLLIPVYCFLYRRDKIIEASFSSFCAVIFYSLFRFAGAHVYFYQIKLAPIMDISLGERAINIPKILLFYLKTFVLPIDLLIFQTWTVKSINFLDFWLPLFLCVGLFALLFLFGFKIRKKSQELFKNYVFFVVWFLLGLSLYIQIIPLDETVSDRYFYFPIIGLLGIIGVIFTYFEKTFRKRGVYLLPIFILIIVLFSTRVVVRNFDWKDGFSLFYHDIKSNRDSYQLNAAMGAILISEGKVKESQDFYIKSSELFPSALTFTNLGYFYMINSQVDKARESLNTALKYGDLHLTYQNLATLHLSSDDPKTAQSFIEDSLKKFPNYSKLWSGLAIAKYKQGDKSGALEAVNKARSIFPDEETGRLLYYIQNNMEINVR